MSDLRNEPSWGEPIEPGDVITNLTESGLVIAGRLLSYTEFTQKSPGKPDGKGYLFTVELVAGQTIKGKKDGDRIRFFAGADLQQKLLGLPTGTLVRIQYKDTQELKGGRHMKVFEVRTAPGSEDEEVPF